MEAASVAWHPLGWEPAGFSEIEPFPAAILAHRFPNTPNHGDLTQHHTWPNEPGSIDLLVGGTPCQSFSVAGLRKGLADPRGNLALTFLALADRIKPRWIIWENVPGVLSSGGGRDFGSFLGALVELGYGFAYRVLDAQYFGVPQRRRRVFVVACAGDWRAPAEVLSLREGLLGHIASGGKKRKGPAADAGAGVEAGCWCDGGQVSQTLDAVLQKGQTMPEKNRFPAVLQPKPIVIDRAAFNQGVNAQYEPHIEESETMDSLVARGPHAVGIPYRKAKRAQSTTDDETWVEGQVSNTLNNFNLGDTRTTHAVVHCSDTAPTVTSSGPPYSRTGNERVEAEALAVMTTPAAMAVRRLTPVECERLQGFPDNWSRISWKGKPAEDCPDGPRYKACGNSMAVPVMRWIGEQIKAYESR
jgi:DNA (cytosine-5)-methyltransferase 1